MKLSLLYVPTLFVCVWVLFDISSEQGIINLPNLAWSANRSDRVGESELTKCTLPIGTPEVPCQTKASAEPVISTHVLSEQEGGLHQALHNIMTKVIKIERVGEDIKAKKGENEEAAPAVGEKYNPGSGERVGNPTATPTGEIKPKEGAADKSAPAVGGKRKRKPGPKEKVDSSVEAAESAPAVRGKGKRGPKEKVDSSAEAAESAPTVRGKRKRGPKKKVNSSARAADSDTFNCPMEPCHLNIAFLGDSLCRYQYMSLAHFLRFNNTWIKPTDRPNMVVAQTYLDKFEQQAHWQNYFKQTMRKLAPYENCDCFRAPWKEQHQSTITENRYFYDPTRNNTITYIQAYGKMKIHGHWLDPVKASREPMKLLQEGAKINRQQQKETEIPMVGPMPAIFDNAWGYRNWGDVVQNHISLLRPDVLVMNAAFWKHDFAKEQVRQSLLDATQKSGIRRVIWKTANVPWDGVYREMDKPVDDAMCGMMECFNITRVLPKSLYHDTYHFQEPVYRKINEDMFSLLGVTVQNSPTLEWDEIISAAPK